MVVKLSGSFLLTALTALIVTAPANAQFSPDVFFGVGTASASSNGQSIDTFGDGTLYGTPRLGGAFGKVGADLMITPHFGISGETDFRFSQGSYAGLTYRPLLYDFNGVWLPTGNRLKRVVPELQAGLGGVNMKFYYPSSYCDAFAGCSSSNQYIESSNHFQVHLEAGVRFYVTNHLFVRPQVDAHWVNNFFQFGSHWVPEYGASIGWTFHRE
jgi:Outer membrane protein beta-barrel domain